MNAAEVGLVKSTQNTFFFHKKTLNKHPSLSLYFFKKLCANVTEHCKRKVGQVTWPTSPNLMSDFVNPKWAINQPGSFR